MKPQGAQVRALADHEQVDVSIRGLVTFVVGLVIAGLVIQVVIWVLLKGLQNKADYTGPYTRPIVRAITKGTYPMLQLDPAQDMERFRAREEATLHTYGWVDRTSGIVRIPVDQAMELLVQRGLPATAGTQSPLQLQQERAQEGAKQP